jgi:hypothetical protein
MTKRAIATVMSTAGLMLAELVPMPALSHHSFAVYDMTRKLTVDGTVKVFRWGAPHSTVVIVAKDKGKNVEMAILSGQPAEFVRQGVAPRDIHPGDKITVVYHPNGNGQPGGVMASMTTADGKTYSSGEVSTATGAGGGAGGGQ